MRVFGNGAIWLFQPKITFTTNCGQSPTFYLDGEPHSVGDVHVWPTKFYTISVSDVPNYSFDHFSYDGGNWGRPCSTQLPHSGAFTAHYNWDPTYYTLYISSSGGGSTNPSGNPEYPSYTNVNVQAAPDNSSRIFDHWILDSEDAGMQNPIKVTMNSNHILQAVFTAAPSYKFVTSINDYNEYVNNPGNLVGWQPNGQSASLTGYGPYEYYGWISATLNAQATGHIYLYGSADYCDGHLYVYVSSNGYNWNFVSAPYVSSGSPYWIDCGLYLNSFNHIMLTAEDPNAVYSVAVDSVRVEPPAYYNLTISSGDGGSTNPTPGVHEYLETTQVPVTANASSGYVFDYWLLDGNSYTQNPITVSMNSNHALQAFFSYAPSHYWASSISDYGGPVYSPANLLGSENDGQFASLEGYGPYEYYGWIEAAMDSQATGHIYVYGCCNALGGGPLYVYVSSNGYNWNYVSAPYVSSSSPYWIDCGTYQNTFNYIAVTAEDLNYVYSLSLDSVRVEP